MNWNLVWVAYTLVFAIACAICDWFLFLRKIGREERCTHHTIGEVIGFSAINYAGIHIPKVKYTVNGKTYKIAGPKFRSGSMSAKYTPNGPVPTEVKTNITTRENLPLNLQIKIRGNSFTSSWQSPLSVLYPVGSAVDVYYNPNKPKDAYVQRFEGVSSWLAWLLGIAAIAILALSLYLFFGPPLVMH